MQKNWLIHRTIKADDSTALNYFDLTVVPSKQNDFNSKNKKYKQHLHVRKSILAIKSSTILHIIIG
uniref:Uncharacterized protein n=1 Tax=Onchocerca volvulus TaxID=6282 RepID=A0A8R1XYS3_ONCVO